MYAVHWTSEALDELAMTWTEAAPTERDAVTNASDEIDRVLARHPDEVGESRGQFRRIGFEPPLVFVFEIDERRAMVFVVHVWKYP